MTSTVTLYKSSILPEKNFYIDDIESYLSGLDKIVITNFQYQKFEGTEKNIKINKNQSMQEFNELNKYNYCKIQNDEPGSKAIYYFILKRDPRAEESIKLKMYMDTVNTLRPGVDFTFNNKSKLYRQHKDRFAPGTIQTRSYTRTFIYSDAGRWEVHNEPSGIYTGIALLSLEIERIEFNPVTPGAVFDNDISYDSSTGIISLSFNANKQGTFVVTYGFTFTFEAKPIVDIYPEGITPVLYKTNSQKILGNGSWNLVYRNREEINPNNYNQVNPVECYAIPDEPTDATVVVGSTNITTSTLGSTYLYISPTTNENKTIKFEMVDSDNNKYYIQIAYITYGAGEEYYNWLKIDEVNGFLRVRDIVTGGPVDNTKTYNNIVSITMTDGPTELNILDTDTNYTRNNPPTTYNDTLTASSTRTVLLNSIDALDRTDARLIKIIKVPYSPVENPAYPDTKWRLNTEETSPLPSVLQLVNLNTKFDYTFDSGLENPMYKLNPITANRIVGSNKNINFETKLLHSDYYRPKFVYDSFGIDFQLELVDTSNPNALTQYLQVGYVITTTIHSKFLFYFPQYILERSFVDFDNILPIARNNEVVLYTSQYINYLRTGYNYDVKAKTRQDIGSVVSTLAAGAGAVAMGFTAVASNQPWLIAMGVSSFVAAATSTVNTIVNNEQQLRTKQAQLKQQAITVEGSDDVDILEAYSDNKAFLNTYEISPRLKEALFNLFYYTGYVFEAIGVPDTSSRMYFNYVQASPIIDLITAIPEYAESDLKARYELGVTFLHNVKGTWDFEQQKENWELSLGGIY